MKQKEPDADAPENGLQLLSNLYPPKRKTLTHEIEVGVETIHHPVLKVKTQEQEEDRHDPFYYAETEIRVTVDGHLVETITAYQGDADLANLELLSMVQYLKQNLPAEITRVALNLCAERRELACKGRDRLIQERKNEDDSALRKRLPIIKEPTSKEVFEFFAMAKRCLHEMAAEAATVADMTKTALCERLIAAMALTDSGNDLQALTRLLEKLKLQYDDLLLEANLHPAQLANPKSPFHYLVDPTSRGEQKT